MIINNIRVYQIIDIHLLEKYNCDEINNKSIQTLVFQPLEQKK